ncbi:MAG TPA: cytochrome c oxidase subunit 4 [Candidatus Baltobacteraceae bacterium]
MKTFVTLFISSATFGIVIAAVYYVWSRGEWAGTLLLGLMAIGLTFASGYAILAERDADLDGDRKDLENADAAGEDLGIYTTSSAWPILMAFSVLVFLIGAVWIPFLLAVGLAAMLLVLWRLGAESSRIA